MLLLDSLYINKSGGLELLKYLVEVLENQRYEVFYLFDNRCKHEFLHIDDSRKCILTASISTRNIFYKEKAKSFSKIFCFGNIPPPIKLSVPVYTYFHNINLLLIPSGLSFKDFIFSHLKRFYYRYYKSNTDYWVVQTLNTKKALSLALNEKNNRILTYPFFDIKEGLSSSHCSRTDYIYVANYVKEKNHSVLINCWEKLAELGHTPTLHLTLSGHPQDLENKIKEAILKGAKIINHGYVEKSELCNLYACSKATIYPSFNESLGLGILEALYFGCDVIGPDLPFIHSICSPSEVFDPNSVNSLVEVVLNYENKRSLPSKALIKNEIESLLNILI